MENLWPPLLQAALGGFLLSVMNFYEDSRKPKNQRVEKDGLFWLFVFVWPVVGAILAYIYIASGYKIDGMLAFTLGLTAPTTVQSLMQKVVSNPPRNAEP
jgi:hypothetical protein